VLVEPDRTPYDLNFRLLGFPVRVHPLFWVVAVLFGADALGNPNLGPVYLLVWVAVVFVSILVHELGHAFAFRACGVGSSVVLYSFGGLAVPWGHVGGRWRRVGVALAGPAAGFVLLGLVWASNRYVHPWAVESLPLFYLYVSLVGVNLYWGLMNLLPVVPLDGGRVSEEVCEAASRRNGGRVALWISVVVGAVVAVYSLAGEVGRGRGAGWFDALPWWVPPGSLWTALLFGILAYQSYQLLRQPRWTESHWDRGY
jgi:Zn-dependent protease